MQDEICPLIKLAEGFSPLDIWQELRANAALWGQENNDIEGKQDRLALSLRMAQRLGELPASRWLGFNHEIGWVREASTVLSWCRGGSLQDIFTIWKKLQFMPAPAPDSEFAALLLKPDLLPENRLSKIIEMAERDTVSVCLLLAARAQLPEIDLPNDVLQHFPAPVIALLQARGLAIAAPQQHVVTDMPGASVSVQEKIPALRVLSSDEAAQQMQARGWTQADVEEALRQTPHSITASDETGAEPAWLHLHPQTGAGVVTMQDKSLFLHFGRPDYVYQAADENHSAWRNLPLPAKTHADCDWLLVSLPQERVKVWRPVEARRLDKNLYCIMPMQTQHSDERWRYGVTAYVSARRKRFLDGEFLMAMDRAQTKY